MDADRSPTVRRRQLGEALRALRLETGLSLTEVAARMECDPSTISRLENARRGVTLRDLRLLLEIYGVSDPGARDSLTALAREARKRGWWQGYLDVLPSGFATYVGLEAEAGSVRIAETAWVPGLLQTPEYARAVLRSSALQPLPQEIERMVTVRARRQQLLCRMPEPLRVRAVLDEAVLHRQVGGAEVMRRQLRNLVDAADVPTVTIQVLPFRIGSHDGMNGAFHILDCQRFGHPDVVYVESLTGSLFQEKPKDVRRYVFAFDHLQAIALDPGASVGLIARIADRMA